jgi:hypothetical protein
MLLPPGGRLYLSTVDVSSAFARLLDMHLYYFKRHTVTALLLQVGFEVRAIDCYTHVVLTRYLSQKLTAAFPMGRPEVRALAASVPGDWRVPINLGDNMLVSAVRPA